MFSVAKHLLLIAVVLLWGSAVMCGELPIGPTKIPFYTGNTSVHQLMMYWGTFAGPASDGETPERVARLKALSCFADCDYPCWCVAEKQQGKWDFSYYANNARLLHEAGLRYATFSWVHFPPKWFEESADFHPYVCAEHGEKLMQLSPWAPNLWELYRRYYTEQSRAIPNVDLVRVSMPSDYGEIGYPAAMTSWLVPQNHAHMGYWCGDQYARADFRLEMKRKFRTLGALNTRWGTAFASWADVAYPDLVDEKAARVARESGKFTDRRRWLDFVEWYYGVWLRTMPKMAGLIREFYPGKPMVASVGYASEQTMIGNDYSAIPKVAKLAGLALQTPGNVGYYAQKRVSTACHFYGCRYYTEPPGDVPPDAEVARVFADISNGVQVYFEYPDNLDRARLQMRKYKNYMAGERPIVDVAIFNPTTDHRLEGGAGGFPANARALGDAGRDLFDYDVVDDYLVRDGALAGYRVLVYCAGQVTEQFALRRIADWVRHGGVLVTWDLGDVETVEGDRSIWRGLVGEDAPTKLSDVRTVGRFDWKAFGRLCVRRVGKGLVIRVPVRLEEHQILAEAVAQVTLHLADLCPGFRNAPLVDGVADGIQTTLLPSRVLYFNGSERPVTKRVVFRPEDWANRAARPEKTDYTLVIAPHSIEQIPLGMR